MRIASTTFKDMLEGKRAAAKVDDASIAEGPFVLEENSTVLLTLLDMIYPGRSPPSTMTTTHFRTVAIAAEKLQMSTIIKALQQTIRQKSPTTTLTSERTNKPNYRSIEEYAIALELGWRDIADEVSSRTLSCDLNSPLARELLLQLRNVTIDFAIFSLHVLHQRRKAWLFNALCLLTYDNKDQLGTDDDRSLCAESFRHFDIRRLERVHNVGGRGCSPQEWRGRPSWLKLKLKVLSMLDRDCSGDQFLTDEFLESSDLRSFVKLSCGCYIQENGGVLKAHFRLIVDQVPKTVQFRIPEKSGGNMTETYARLGISTNSMQGRRRTFRR